MCCLVLAQSFFAPTYDGTSILNIPLALFRQSSNHTLIHNYQLSVLVYIWAENVRVAREIHSPCEAPNRLDTL
jgi:hypothetical protein